MSDIQCPLNHQGIRGFCQWNSLLDGNMFSDILQSGVRHSTLVLRMPVQVHRIPGKIAIHQETHLHHWSHCCYCLCCCPHRRLQRPSFCHFCHSRGAIPSNLAYAPCGQTGRHLEITGLRGLHSQTGAHHDPLHWLLGPDFLQLFRLSLGKGRHGSRWQIRFWYLCWCPLVGSGKNFISIAKKKMNTTCHFRSLWQRSVTETLFPELGRAKLWLHVFLYLPSPFLPFQP